MPVAAAWMGLSLASVFLTASPAESIDVSDHRQVFVDRTFLPEAKGVQLQVHPPVKTGERNVVCDRPWEKGGLGPYSSVLFHDGKYHMWYHVMDNKIWHTSPEAGAICYATSTDGIQWTKPDLGIIEYEGSKANNIVVGHGAADLKLGQDGVMVFVDPTAPADERFRMVNRMDQLGEGVHLLSSPDGIRWKTTHKLVVTARPEKKGHHLDSQNVIFWDPNIRKYVCYVRRNRMEPGSQGRSVARGESEKLTGFPAVQDMPFVLNPDALDVTDGVTLVDYYNSGALLYPWADRAYYLFPQAYYHYTKQLTQFSKDCPTNAGPLDTHFASSRDGIHWERYDRRAFVPIGMKGDFDCHTARMIHGLIPDTKGREMFMYYRGSDWLHGWDRDDRNRKILTDVGLAATQDITVLSRVVLRRDGFVSVQADYAGGEFTTPPLRFSGSKLALNIDTAAVGTMRVEVIGEDGQPAPGFASSDCDVIHTANTLNHVVTWKGASDLSSLAGKAIRLRFIMRSGDLYAFQFQK